ncbi:MAG: HAD-IIA family hydrolase [Anaerolineae bacterium]|nr:HAD-IIA family hydrolase [Anaerolineae bacterium]MDW8299905.1 HAD-IIA family hydrolase [Anaerolineae bacterium]
MLDLRAIRACALDLDGVVWREDEKLPAVPDFFHFLRTRGIPYAFITNNSTRTPAQYLARLDAFDIPATAQQVITSGAVAAEEIARRFPQGTPFYAIGSQNLIDLIAARGYPYEPDYAQIVVVGLDRSLTYDKLKIAGQRILAGAAFIATNGDATFPLPNGEVAPGAGSLVSAVATMTGKQPFMIGKPAAPMFEAALRYFGVPAAHALMIGDRLDTDILGAQSVGMKSALVLTGVSRADQIGAIVPDGVFADLAELLSAWQSSV